MYGDVMRMKNKTEWDTKQLQKVVREICRVSGLAEPRVCEFEKSRSHWFHGLGTLGGSWIKIFIPTKRYVCGFDGKWQFVPLESLSGGDMATLIIHELRHNTGTTDSDMLDNFDSIDLSKVNMMVIGKRKEKLKVPRDLVSERSHRVIGLIADKESRVKRLQNQLKKLYKRKKYYGRNFSEGFSRQENSKRNFLVRNSRRVSRSEKSSRGELHV